MTSGSLISVSSGTTGAVATNGLVSIQATAAYTSTANIGALTVLANSTVTGTVVSVQGAAMTTGIGLFIKGTAATLTTGRYLSVNDAATEVFGIGTNGHIISTVSAVPPTIAVTTQNGITAAAITAGGSDTCGVITTTGTNNAGGDTVLTVTYGKTYTTAPKAVILMAANSAGAKSSATTALEPWVSSVTATTFVVHVPSDATAAATPSFMYLVIA
jgi:hypothetical protein